MASQLLDSSPLATVPVGIRDEDAPAKIGKYRVLGTLGEGGMSVVYRARDEALDRTVAVKLLHRHLARDPEARARFTREARAVARLTHRNIPEIFDFSGSGVNGTNVPGLGSSPGDDGKTYIVSELVDGAPLSRLLRDGQVPLPELGICIAMGVGHALMHAHAHQVIHRDVKPENVLVGRDGVVKLTDFGIAQVHGLESMTMTGTLIGSPAHMAPEQIDGTRDLDARLDVWGFGTVLYMVAANGRLPFEADNAHQLLRKVVQGEYTDPRRVSPHIDAELAGIIRRCLQVERAARYPDIAGVMKDLERWLAVRDLAQPEREVQAFMADAPGYTTLLVQRLEATFMRLGDEAMAKRNAPLALERLGRVLTLDPDHDVALERVRRVETRLRTKRKLLWGSAVAIVAGGVVAAVVAWPDPPTTPSWPGGARLSSIAQTPTQPVIVPRPTEPERGDPPVKAGDPLAGMGFGAALEAEATRFEAVVAAREEKSHETPVKPREKEPAHVRVTAYPPAVTITIKGKGTDLPTPAMVELPPGRYTVVLRHKDPAFAPDTHTLVVPESAAGEDYAPDTLTFVERPAKAVTTSLLVNCRSPGDVARDVSSGKQYGCNRTYELEVDPKRPTTLTLELLDKDGNRIEAPRLFTVNAQQKIVW